MNHAKLGVEYMLAMSFGCSLKLMQKFWAVCRCEILTVITNDFVKFTESVLSLLYYLSLCYAVWFLKELRCFEYFTFTLMDFGCNCV